MNGASTYPQVTDLDGRFQFQSTPDGEYWLAVDSSTIPASDAPPRMTRVSITSNMIDVYPRQARLGVTTAAGTLSGQVQIDGVAVTSGAIVFVSDSTGMVAQAMADVSGNYSFRLPAGTYTVFAQLLVPNNEVPTPLTSFALTTDVTGKDISFSTSATSQLLSGSATVGGVPHGTAVLAYVDASPPEPVAMVFADEFDGTFSMRLPVGNFEISLIAPGANGVVTAEPVSVSIGASEITGTDVDGSAISGNVLSLDPFGASTQGEVRAAVTSFYQAWLDGNVSALTASLDSTALWNGMNKSETLSYLQSQSGFGDRSRRIDQLVGYYTSISGSEAEMWVKVGRSYRDSDRGNALISYWDERVSDNPQHKFTVKDDGSNWVFAGNGQQQQSLAIEHAVINERDDMGSDTMLEEIELIAERRGQWPSDHYRHGERTRHQ